jgi:hypothetical protein
MLKAVTPWTNISHLLLQVLRSDGEDTLNNKLLKTGLFKVLRSLKGVSTGSADNGMFLHVEQWYKTERNI